ncbi:MAG: hypothetical protein JXB05_33270 [Myxococcaceae bacterium]|nr:hypothetical protein [Myxococcaceae bacterium]
MSLHAEIIWGSGYALFLLGVARGLVALGRRARAEDTSWPSSEVARFHQGLAMPLVLLAGLLVGACAVRHPGRLELGWLGLVSLVIAWVARRTWKEWREESSAGET